MATKTPVSTPPQPPAGAPPPPQTASAPPPKKSLLEEIRGASGKPSATPGAGIAAPTHKANDIQAAIDKLVKREKFFTTIKLPLAWDARVMPPGKELDDKLRVISYYIGLKGSGKHGEDRPYTLYFVGPALKNSDGSTWDIKKNYDDLFDGMDLAYPLDKIGGLIKEAAKKEVTLDGNKIKLPQVTAMDAPVVTEVYSQVVDGDWVIKRDEQLSRLNNLHRNYFFNYNDEKIKKISNDLKATFGALDFTTPSFSASLETLRQKIAQHVFEIDDVKNQPWLNHSLAKMRDALEKDPDIAAPISTEAQKRATNMIAETWAHLAELKMTCEGFALAGHVAALPNVRIIKEKSAIKAFHRMGCKAASKGGDPKKGALDEITVSNVKSCLNYATATFCTDPIDRETAKLQSLLDKVVAADKRIADLELQNQNALAMEEVMAQINAKFAAANPGKVETKLREALEGVRKFFGDPGADEPDDESWDDDDA